MVTRTTASTRPLVRRRAPAIPPSQPLDERVVPRQVVDRAHWLGGGVVQCDLSEVDLVSAMLHVDPLAPSNGMDPLALRTALAHDDQLYMTVTHATGETLVEGRDRSWRKSLWRASWSGAEPGMQANCRLEAVQAGTVSVNFTYADGTPFTHLRGVREMVVGCGMRHAIFDDRDRTFPVPSTSCALHAELAWFDFPRLGHGEDIAVSVPPGQHHTVTLVVPDEPDLWQIPPLHGIALAADTAAFVGLLEVSDALEDAWDDVHDGRWSADSLQSLHDAVQQARHIAPDSR